MFDRSKAGATQPTSLPRLGFNQCGTYAGSFANATSLRRNLEIARAAKPQQDPIKPIAFMTGSRP
jgi:hypothetical protein